MTADVLVSIFRTLLQVLGAFLIGRGWMTDGNWELISGAVITIIPTAWMVWSRWNTTPVAVQK